MPSQNDEHRAMTTHKHYMWELHPTQPNQYVQHWLETEQARDRGILPALWSPLPSCKDQACCFWSTCYGCNDCPATLLVDKAEFMARKEFETEYEYDLEPTNHALLHPHTPFAICHLTDPDDLTHVERKKDIDWHSSKGLHTSRIALALAWQEWFPESFRTTSKNKEDFATVDQVRKELDYRRYHNHEQINITKNISRYHPDFNDENKPVNKRKQDPEIREELFLDNGDGSKFSVGYAPLANSKNKRRHAPKKLST